MNTPAVSTVCGTRDRLALVAGLAAALLGSACNGDPDDTGTDTTPPQFADVQPAEGAVLSHDEAIELTFDESLEPDSVELGGSLAAQSDGGAWSSAAGTYVSLTISPATTWLAGPDQTLTVTATDLAGNQLEALELSFDCAVVYVSVDDPEADDANPGTKLLPLEHIHAAVSKASLDYVSPSDPSIGAQVLVAEGTYEVDSTASSPTHVVLEGGVSLLGGYSQDWSQRDPSSFETIIEDQAASGGGPNSPVVASGGTLEDTVIDGLTLRAGGGNGSAGIFSYGSPTISHNVIHGGTGTTCSAIATIGHSTIVGNVIDGGSGESSRGVELYQGAVVQNNVISGGSGELCYGVTSTSDNVIQNNTITCDGVQKSEGISLNQGGDTIENNIVFIAASTGTRYCVAEWYGGADPTSLRNNDLFDCGTALYLDEGTTERTVEGDLNDVAKTTQGVANSAEDNLSLDPSFVDEAGGDYQFQANGSSPCAVTEGGLDLSTDIPTDIDGRPRTSPLSIGAYEHDDADGGCTP